MRPGLVAAIWLLVTLDCALMGFRLAMGRSAAIDKRRYYRRAAVRAGLMGQVAIGAVTTVAVVLAHSGGTTTTGAFNRAMPRFILIGGGYAALILGASALCAFPSVTLRSALSVVIFGPLTLLRPVVVIVTVGYAVWSEASAPIIVVALLVAVPGVVIEPLLDRRIARRLGMAQVRGRKPAVSAVVQTKHSPGTTSR
jgi:uncharacterized integral membrane protein